MQARRQQSSRGGWALAASLLLGSCASTPGPVCSESELRAALEDSYVGQVIRIGACRVDVNSTLVVPAGVRLEGQSETTSVLVSSGTTATSDDLLALPPGDGDTALAQLSIEYAGTAVAIHAPQQLDTIRGLTIESVTVRATHGIAIAIRNRQPLRIAHVTLAGPVTAESAMSLSAEPTTADTATVGIALVSVGSTTTPATIEDLTVTGFGGRGAAYVDGIIRWNVGMIAGNAGVGVVVQGGNVVMDGVTIDGTLPLSGGLVPGLSMAASGGAEIGGAGLEIGNATGYGLVLFDGTAALDDLSVHDNSLAGVWSQGSVSLTLRGAGTSVARNGGAGVAALGTRTLAIEGGRIEDTRAIPRVIGGMGVQMVGDGLHVVSGTDIDHVDGIILAGNARVGMLLDAGGGALSGAITNVTVSGTGTELGAVAQNGTIPSSWDSGIMRSGDVVANDAAFTGTLPILGDRLTAPALGAVDGI